VDNLQHCPNCGWPLEPDDKFCRNCGKPFEERREETPQQSTPPIPPTSLTPPTPPTPPDLLPPSEPEEEKYVPWEGRQRLGFFAALWKTWAESVFNPDRFFSKLPYKGGLGSPILYALIVAWLSVIVNSLYQIAFSSVIYNFWLNVLQKYTDQSNPIFNSEFFRGITLLSFFQSIFIAPIGILILLFFISGIYHLLCMIFGWAKRDFEATVRTVSYSFGPLIFAILPFCGSTIGWIWGLVLSIIGLKHMQQISGGKATFVVLLPLILCCCLSIIILLVIFGSALFSIFSGCLHSGY
jgi:hypothetical protein